MPKAKSEKEVVVPSEKTSLDRIAKLLAVIATKGETQGEQILALNRIGFSNSELADLVGTTPAVVSQALYASRIKPKKKKYKVKA